MIVFKNEFEDCCFKIFESDSKIGLLCCISPDGYPHISLISSIGVKDKKTMFWGQFSQGLSKEYLKTNPKTGFLVVSPDRRWWTGKALHTGSVVKGEDFDYFNNKPLFRYNSYCGFGAVHYGQIVDASEGEQLPLLKIALGFFASGLLKRKALRKKESSEIIEKMPLYGIKLACGLASLKFAAFIDTDGFPRLFPVMQGQSADANTLVFSASPYSELIKQIPDGAKTAVFLANMSLESLLLQGCWHNTIKKGKLKNSRFDIDKVYNSMLPLCGYVYPPKTLPNVYGI